MDERNDELRGWKEIAGYLGKSVRAAQRWETLYGLPVRRIAVPSRSAIVYARRSEIEAWKAGLDPRALQDEDEDETFSPVDVDADASGNANGHANGNGSAERTAPGADDETSVLVAGGPVTPGGPGLAEAPPSMVVGTEGGAAAVARASARSRRLWPWLLPASLAVAVAFATVVWSRAGGAESSSTILGAVPVDAAEWDRTGLDVGPWPVTGHDRRNSYQSHLLGPARPAEARLLYESSASVLTTDNIAAASDGTYILGTCDGEVLSVDPEGRVRRHLRLDRQPNREAASGFALTPSDIYISTLDCPHDAVVNVRTQMTVVDFASGNVTWRYRTGAQSVPPAVASDGGWLQLDQYNTLRRMAAPGAPKWVVDFPGFTAATPAQDAGGVVYVPTDGGSHGHRSLWAVAPDGKVLWGSGTEAFTQATVGSDSNVYVFQTTADVLGTRGTPDMVRSFDRRGTERWAVAIPSDPTLRGVARFAVSRNGDIVVKTAASIRWLSPTDGSTRADAPLRGPWRGSSNVVLDAAGNAYHSADGHVVSLSPDGLERWSVELPNAGTLLIGQDGEVVVIVDQRKLYVIRDVAARAATPPSH